MKIGRNVWLGWALNGLVIALGAGCSVSERNGYKFADEEGGQGGAGGVASARGGASAGSGGSVPIADGGAAVSGGAGVGTSGAGAGGALVASAGGAAPSGAGGASSGVGGSAAATNGGTETNGGATTSSGGSSGGATGAGGSDLCGQQLLRNANFDQGDVEWQLASNFPGVTAIVRSTDPALVAENVAPKSGDFLAWLGGFPDNKFDSHYMAITQVIHVPAAASSLTLTGYVRIKTEEPDVNNTFDRGFIQLEYADDRPDLLWLPVEWTVDRANSDWVQFSAVQMDMAKISGQDVMLRAQAELDPNLKTSFWLDSLSLVAKCGR